MRSPIEASPTLYSETSLPPELSEGSDVLFFDITADSAEALRGLLPPDEAEAEEARFAYYPWRRTVVKIPGPRSYRRLRLDRNRHKLTTADQERGRQLKVGIVGLSVGHSIALTLALEGLAGELRLADFDSLELTNMNRIPASLMDIGVNKAVVASRRISEIDPYISTTIFDEGITTENVDTFLDGLDIVVEECDSFDAKVLIRERSRTLGIPVLMETSDGGTLDVERFDLDRDRPLFHGLAGDLRADDLVGLDRGAVTALAVRVLEPAKVTAAMAASALELGYTVTAWPQLGGDVLLGGASVAAAVRRLVQDRPLPSGRVRFDRDTWLGDIVDPLADPLVMQTKKVLPEQNLTKETCPEDLSDSALVVDAANRAPSAGNQQPWRVTADADGVTIALDPDRTSTLDLGHRASAVAVGAAAANAQIAAASRGILGATKLIDEPDQIAIRISLGPAGASSDPDHRDTDMQSLRSRSTRRGLGDRSPVSPGDVNQLVDVATTEQTRLNVLTDRTDISRSAAILASSDRIRFLTPELHREMFAELTDDPANPIGIQINSLGFPPAMMEMMGLLRRSDVMALLDEWGGGNALGADAAGRVESASAMVTLIQTGTDTASFLRAGLVMQRLWLAAERLGFAVHPMTPCFLYAQNDEEARSLSPAHGDELATLRREMLTVCPVGPGETPTVVLRLSRIEDGPR